MRAKKNKFSEQQEAERICLIRFTTINNKRSSTDLRKTTQDGGREEKEMEKGSSLVNIKGYQQLNETIIAMFTKYVETKYTNNNSK